MNGRVELGLSRVHQHDLTLAGLPWRDWSKDQVLVDQWVWLILMACTCPRARRNKGWEAAIRWEWVRRFGRNKAACARVQLGEASAAVAAELGMVWGPEDYW